MELRIKVETVFEDGRLQEHELGSWKRSPESLNPEAINKFSKKTGDVVSLTLKTDASRETGAPAGGSVIPFSRCES